MNYSFILLAAGKGVRLGKATPKQFLPLAGKPMIVHTLERADKLPQVSEIIVVCASEFMPIIRSYADNYGILKCIRYVEGGATRQESVYNGLLASSEDMVIIHEAARPLVSLQEFEELIQVPHDNVTLSYSIPFTVLKKSSANLISDILNREELVNIQLPQKFSKSTLLSCHKKALAEHRLFTEDASVVKFYSDTPIHCIPGSASNIKITEYTDILFGEILFKEKFMEESII